jgi:hypothetical protein
MVCGSLVIEERNGTRVAPHRITAHDEHGRSCTRFGFVMSQSHNPAILFGEMNMSGSCWAADAESIAHRIIASDDPS